jgi:hypothetical protein
MVWNKLLLVRNPIKIRFAWKRPMSEKDEPNRNWIAVSVIGIDPFIFAN